MVFASVNLDWFSQASPTAPSFMNAVGTTIRQEPIYTSVPILCFMISTPRLVNTSLM